MSMVSGIATKTIDDPEAMDKLVAAKTIVTASWPYLHSLMWQLAARWTDQVPTIGVDDKWRLYLNPSWVKTQHAGTLALIIAGHELQHLFGEHSRRLTEHQDKFVVNVQGCPCSLSNLAHDLAINSALQSFLDSAKLYRESQGYTPFPMKVSEEIAEGAYPNKYMDSNGRPFPTGLISEDYADLLIRHAKPTPQCGKANSRAKGKGKDKDKGKGNDDGDGEGKGNGAGDGNRPHAASGRCGSGGGGPPEDYEDRSPVDPTDQTSGTCREEQEIIRKKVAQEIIEQDKKARGTVPAGLRLLAEKYFIPSKVNWVELLKGAIRSAVNKVAGQHDFTYTRLNKRQEDHQVRMPTLFAPAPKVMVALDTSGSMGKKDYELAFGHIHGVMRSLGFTKIPVFCCDARAGDVQWISSLKDLELEGGGGTDMSAAIDQAAKLKHSKLLIVLTDGETGWPAHKIKSMDVVACLTRKPHCDPPPSWIRTIIQE